MLIYEYCISVFTLGEDYSDAFRARPIRFRRAPFGVENGPFYYCESIGAYVQRSKAGWHCLQKLGMEAEGER